ncbi:unnamed protein product, partial [Hermetia illucens]
MCEDIEADCKRLEPAAIFGFDGQVSGGLQLHPDHKHLIFPLGNKLAVTNLTNNKQKFLCGHTNTISCLDISKSGKYLGSGQVSQRGFQAYTILWDWCKNEEITRHELHKERVQAVCFTSQDQFLVSLGGEDDGTLIIYDIEMKTPIIRTPAAKRTSGSPLTLLPFHRSSSIFIVAGDRHLRVWTIERESRKMQVLDASLGKIQRRFTGLRISEDDHILYAGTMSGDILKVRLNITCEKDCERDNQQAILLGCYARHNPRKPKGKDCEKYVNGVREVYIVGNGQLLIGAGDGSIELVEERNVVLKDYNSPTWPQFKSIKHTKVNGAVTSITKLSNSIFLIGTDNNEVYTLALPSFDLKLHKTCHKATVYDIVFPKDYPQVFATASYECIRIWSTTRLKEILRIMVYNFSAASIVFTNDGSSIISAWNDGVIRAFTPITGRLIFAIPNAHNKGCSAVTISSNGKVLVSGGMEGQVRVWKIEPHRQSLVGVLKEHSGNIASVDFNKFDTEVVSACSDGTCIIWDINRLTRKHVLYANTQFKCARYYPTGVQIIAAGTDRRISYWEVYDGTLAREVIGSPKGFINSLSLNQTGEYFISVSNDQTVK